MRDLAPIAFFAFNRPEHTQRTLEALSKNELASKSRIFIFCDGPRGAQDIGATEEVRDICKNITGFRESVVIERPSNEGLARNIIKGVTSICNDDGRTIVLEDDILTSKHFLTYMNDGLNCYASDKRVISIGAYVPPLRKKPPETYFLVGAECWGWATWKRAWDLFEPDGKKLKQELIKQDRLDEFDLEGYAYNLSMLDAQIEGKNNSWAIRWHATAFTRNMLTLYPYTSLVFNFGRDGSGTHCVAENPNSIIPNFDGAPINVKRQPVEPCHFARKLWKYQDTSNTRKVLKYLKRIAQKKLGLRFHL